MAAPSSLLCRYRYYSPLSVPGVVGVGVGDLAGRAEEVLQVLSEPELEREEH